LEIKVNNMILKNALLKASMASLVGLFSFSAIAAEFDVVEGEGTGTGEVEAWVDMSDPTSVYSSATIGGGSEGIDLSASYGGYLSGLYKQRFTIAAKHNSDFYEANYLLLNSATNSGIAFDSSWSKDIRVDSVDYDNINDTSVGFFAKLGFNDEHVFFYPKVSVGYLWSNDIEDTTYVKFDATTRYSFNPMYWVGVTPTYAYGFKGADLNKVTLTVDAGVQLSEVFGVSVSANNDEEITANVTFVF
tara:strand:+ start:1455 stop:2192 length:738 start_codon:yes stop_codon:yes gene_type:complete